MELRQRLGDSKNAKFISIKQLKMGNISHFCVHVVTSICVAQNAKTLTFENIFYREIFRINVKLIVSS